VPNSAKNVPSTNSASCPATVAVAVPTINVFKSTPTPDHLLPVYTSTLLSSVLNLYCPTIGDVGLCSVVPTGIVCIFVA